MEVKADDLWPLVLHFVREYLSEEDLEEFSAHFKLETSKVDEHPLVKAGGIQKLLESFFKANKKEYRKFKAFTKGDTLKEDDAVVGKKRKRAGSNVSELASAGAIKRRRASSIVSEASAIALPVVEAKDRKPLDFKFARIDASKFEGKIAACFMDNTFEAKEKFGGGGDSYGKWSSDKLVKVVGKGFVKEKNKMKNRQSHASGRFNEGAINSIKF